MANTIINGGASPYPKSASGSIITITDGADNTPLKSAVVNIEPVQDLHGYDYPWPAGGGKNLVDTAGRTTTTNSGQEDYTHIYTEGCTGVINGDAVTATITGAWSKLRYKFDTSKLSNGQTYTFSALFSNPDAQTLLVGYNNGSWHTSTSSTATSVRLSVTFTFSSSWTSLILGCMVNNTAQNTDKQVVAKEVQLEVGSSATSYAPYSNICPISGWSEVKVWVKPTYDTTLTPTATIPLGRTVYGGYVDALAGKCVVTHKGVDMGSLTWVINGTIPGGYQYGTYSLSDKKVGETNLICPMFYTHTPTQDIGTICGRAASAFVACNSTEATAPAFTTAVTGQTLVYELATPIEVDLTPQTIRTLLGTNNIWADAGSMEIEYYPAAASIVAVQNRSTKAYVSIPLGMIRYETYQITPQQTIDLDSYRSENGNLLRNPVATKCKLEFNTPLMTDTQWAEIWNIIKAGFNNNTERKLKLKYYDTLSATYKTGYFYVPDVQTTIRNIEEAEGVINYQEIRLAFIEY